MPFLPWHALEGGGGCPCVHALLRYLLVLFDPKVYLKLPSNGSMTNWPQPGVCHSIIFPYTLFGAWGVWGASYTYMYFTSEYTEPGLFFLPQVGSVCTCWCVCLCGPLLGCPP
jgi:hypothetical protein